MSRRGPLPEDQLTAATAGLKEFQWRTVRTVVDAMFEQGQRRFLVADEVGLGKTKVARAVVAETVRRLWHDDDVDRIDVVYICSNSQIARQNVADLDVLGGASSHTADRLTMLPTALNDLQARPVNVIAFSPHTSLTFGQARGRVSERAMLFHLLAQDEVLGRAWASRGGARRLFAMDTKSFGGWLRWTRTLPVPAEVATAYRGVLARRGLIERVERLSDGRRTLVAHEWNTVIADLRRALAEACIGFLTPDLIVLDEFQRFTSILDGESEDAELARMLFSQKSARVLMLSATPYRMWSRSGDGDESHVDGFARTLEFLHDGAAGADAIRSDLGELRRAIVRREAARDVVVVRDRVQDALRRVMVRTERLASTPDRDGMLRVANDGTCAVEPQDVTAFVGVDAVTQMMPEIPAVVEYWKSAPYLINFMDEYKVKREIREGWVRRDARLVPTLHGPHMLDPERIEGYDEIDSQHPRTRWLVDALNAEGAFDRLWMPPTLPQTELQGAYRGAEAATKRLIFSGWAVAPKAVTGLVSYEFERRHHREGVGYREAHASGARRLLDLPALSSDAASERYSTLAMLLPNRALATIGDPLRIAREAGLGLPLSLEVARTHAASTLERALAPLLGEAAAEGRRNNAWYALALAWLDRDVLSLDAQAWRGRDGRDAQGLSDHLKQLRVLASQQPSDWGAPPPDLVERLTDLALGGPAVLALRSLERVRASRFPEVPAGASELRAAARVAWGFRSFFNTPETDALVSADGTGDYWERVLKHGVAGGLGSVLDEWFHLLPDQMRDAATADDPLGVLADAAWRVLSLRDGQMRVDFFGDPTSDDGLATQTMRTHFAMRFGQARGQTAEGENPVDVRQAFNSPFRPFVLMSTSVGQEGLDFHHYAHAVVHWNLPSTPVDLEQREGRVHRYKNHAVRKNVADRHGGDPRIVDSDDPWSALFDAADDGDGGMRPWWVYPGRAAIERHVPLLPMSRDAGRLEHLVRATGLYRMTIGQPRQAELVEVLASLKSDEQEALRSATTIDLSPSGL